MDLQGQMGLEREPSLSGGLSACPHATGGKKLPPTSMWSASQPPAVVPGSPPGAEGSPWLQASTRGELDGLEPLDRRRQSLSAPQQSITGSATAPMSSLPPQLSKQPIRPKIRRKTAPPRPAACPVSQSGSPARPVAVPRIIQSRSTGRSREQEQQRQRAQQQPVLLRSMSEGGGGHTLQAQAQPPRAPVAATAVVDPAAWQSPRDPEPQRRGREHSASTPTRPPARAAASPAPPQPPHTSTWRQETSPVTAGAASPVSPSVIEQYTQLRLTEGEMLRPGTVPAVLPSQQMTKNIYGLPSKRMIKKLRANRQVTAEARQRAEAWRAKQEESIMSIKEKRAELSQMADEEVKAEAKKAMELRSKLGLESISSRYEEAVRRALEDRKALLPPPAPVKDQTPTSPQRPPTEVEVAANKAIRARQEELLEEKAKQRERERLAAAEVMEKKEAAKKAAQQAVLMDIAKFRSQGGFEKLDNQRRVRDQVKKVKDEQARASRSPTIQPSGGGMQPLPGQTVEAGLDRWRKRFGVPAGVPVFIADGYGEQLAKKLLARGWARNPFLSSTSFNLVFLRRSNDISFDSLATEQILNHYRGSDALTLKSGLHQCVQSLPSTAGVDPSHFYPRSYYFSNNDGKDLQMQAFVSDFQSCSATAVLWATAMSRDGNASFQDGSWVRIDPTVVELCLSHFRWYLRSLGSWATVHMLSRPESRGFGAASEAKGGPGARMSSAWPPATMSSSLTESQWTAVCQHAQQLSSVVKPSYPPDLSALRAHICGQDCHNDARESPWQGLRERAVHALVSLQDADPQARLNGPGNIWVVKPGGAARGWGIKVMSDMGKIMAELQTGPPRIVQKYVERPLLLGDHKVDLRVWVVVLSLDPLVAYMYDQVMVRPASQAYTVSQEQLSNPAIHLCNHSVQDALQKEKRRLQTASGSPVRGSSGRAGSPGRSGSPARANSRLITSANSMHPGSDSPSHLRPTTTGSPSLFALDAQGPGGTVVATVEAGRIKYFCLDETQPGSGDEQGTSPGGISAVAAQATGPDMLPLKELLPYIGAVCPDEGSDEDEDIGEWDGQGVAALHSMALPGSWQQLPEETAEDLGWPEDGLHTQHGDFFPGSVPSPGQGAGESNSDDSEEEEEVTSARRQARSLWDNGLTPMGPVVAAEAEGGALETEESETMDGTEASVRAAQVLPTTRGREIWARGMALEQPPVAGTSRDQERSEVRGATDTASEEHPLQGEQLLKTNHRLWASGMSPEMAREGFTKAPASAMGHTVDGSDATAGARNGPSDIGGASSKAEASGRRNSLWASGMAPEVPQERAAERADAPASLQGREALEALPSASDGPRHVSRSLWASGMTPEQQTPSPSGRAMTSASAVAASRGSGLVEVGTAPITRLDPADAIRGVSDTPARGQQPATASVDGVTVTGAPQVSNTEAPGGGARVDRANRRRKGSVGLWADGMAPRAPGETTANQASNGPGKSCGRGESPLSAAAEGAATAPQRLGGEDTSGQSDGSVGVRGAASAAGGTDNELSAPAAAGRTAEDSEQALLQQLEEELRLRWSESARRSSCRSTYEEGMSALGSEHAPGWRAWKKRHVPAMRDAAAAVLAGIAAARPQDSAAAHRGGARPFELFGLDFILDGAGERVWLLEINESPDLRFHSQAKAAACSDMLDDLLDLVAGHIDVQNGEDGILGRGPEKLPSAWENPPCKLGGWTRINAPADPSHPWALAPSTPVTHPAPSRLSTPLARDSMSSRGKTPSRQSAQLGDSNVARGSPAGGPRPSTTSGLRRR